ncbi:hypothetical protein BJX61DRAFT_316905 [Aspergillus egyptiacus]|nr:hypothetical protein BJX61DRAFT_316905 [Aspergillus egyptiacus]
MEAASLGLAVVGVIEMCRKYGNRLVSLCRQYRQLDTGLDEIILAIQGSWLKLEVQLKSLKSLWDTLQPQLQVLYHDVLTRLRTKLEAATENFTETQEQRDVAFNVRQKLKVVYLKRQLTETVADIEEWQRRFDPSWYLIARIASPVIDMKLHSVPTGQQDLPSMRLVRMRDSIKQISSQGAEPTEPIFKDATTIMGQMCRVEGTNAYLSRYRYSNTTRRILLDPANSAGQTTTATARLNVRDLARLLLYIDPMTFNLLRCDGVVEIRTDQGNQFHLLFEIPEGLSSPRTLRHLLAASPKCSLSHRFQLAKQLARSVMFVHAAGFVHKNIRPETVLVFEDDSANTLGPSFLIGFERIRRAEGRTDQSGDLQWEKNLYRHPLRQGSQPEDIFEMRHDVYSLGVCLLEMGLWSSFVCLENEGSTPVPWSGLGIDEALVANDQRRGAFAVKSQLVTLSKDLLPAMVGERYTSVVIACLCCLDDSEDNSFRDDESMQDRDGIIVGVRYIENVLLKLEELFA